VLISYGEPMCITYAKRIVDDVSIVHDPPVGNLDTVATAKPTGSGAAAAEHSWVGERVDHLRPVPERPRPAVSEDHGIGRGPACA
jgi:hypothetical protein